MQKLLHDMEKTSRMQLQLVFSLHTFKYFKVLSMTRNVVDHEK